MNVIAGDVMQKLNRHCALDYWTTPELANCVHSFATGANYFAVYPMKINSTRLTAQEAAHAASVLTSSGESLRQQLLDLGILYKPSQEELAEIRNTVRAALAKHTTKRQRTRVLQLLRKLGVVADASSVPKVQINDTLLLFRNERYNHFFTNAAFVHRDRLDNKTDPWVHLRCTCPPFQTWPRCEHIAHARSICIPSMVDAALDPGMRYATPQIGRKKGSVTTVRGAAAAKKRAQADSSRK